MMLQALATVHTITTMEDDVTRRNEIKTAAIAEIRSFTPKKYEIREDSHVINDLKLASDDFTDMAIGLEKKYNVWIPREEWSHALTVKAIMDLLEKHLEGNTTNI
ncbi:hypothetical protein [Rhodomicrobium lacus]|uniref:hypothetical protein n=1 Tax=Rhodomicrobium lacus TaxID=2498452 RepID=UPI000F8DECF6|nr:hypothetical protein [Rhodomicrobium lacus]